MNKIVLPSCTIEQANEEGIQEDRHRQTRLVSHARKTKRCMCIHMRQTHSNFCTFKFHVYIISYTRLLTKLNLFKILFYSTFTVYYN